MNAVFLWIPSLFLLVFGLLYGGRGLYEARIQRLLQRKGVDTEAVVTGHWVMGTSRSGNTYYVKYSFRDRGKEYQREEQVGSSRYKVWPRGTVIHVRYLPQNPYVVRITSEKNHFLSTGVAIIALVLLMLVLAFLFL